MDTNSKYEQLSGLKYVYQKIEDFFSEVGEVALFSGRFFRTFWQPPYEWRELLNQSYFIGNKSIFLVSLTGFIMGLVLDLQSRPTMIEFGAVSWMPSMVGITIVREMGPMITALICAGKVGSSIGAELGSMRVTEQIAAMEVSGTNPYKYLVVTRVVATTLMLPLLVILGDAFALGGSFLVENLKGNVSFHLYFNQVFDSLAMGDIVPSTIKTFFFGAAIGLVGCYKGYTSSKGTAGVGKASNSAVVVASVVVFVLDFMAVLIADLFYEL
ncbi:MAG: ABC transporter permease [Saprospiraceae bacterium]